MDSNFTEKNNFQILIYQTEGGKTKIEVRLENETVWLTQKLMAELFQTTKHKRFLQKQRRSSKHYHIMCCSSRHCTIYSTGNVVLCVSARGS